MSDWKYRQSKADSIENLLRICSPPIFEGLLSEEERAVIPELVEAGVVRRVYEGAGGFLGLAKIEKVA